MYIVAIAWLYVAVLMAVAEATHSTGTLLGGIITFVLYGVLPMVLVLYVIGTPARRRAIKARESAELQAAQAALSSQPDAGSETAGDAVTPVRKEA
jgi:membrane protein implicated in regulation of membrane protease activity